MFHNSMQHLLAELERIDLLIQLQLRRVQAVQPSLNEFHGMYISDQQIMQILEAPTGTPAWAAAPLSADDVFAMNAQLAAQIEQRKHASLHAGIRLRLVELADSFDLSPFDLDLLLIAFAPELDLRYERLYSYLQNDINRQRPGIDLVLNLRCPDFESKIAGRAHLDETAPLLRYRLLQRFSDPQIPHAPLLSQFLKVDARIADYLLGQDTLHLPFVECIDPDQPFEADLLSDATVQRLAMLIEQHPHLIFYLYGRYGSGKQTTARALCQHIQRPLLLVDGRAILQAPDFEEQLHLIERERRLQDAVIYWDHFEALQPDSHHHLLRLLLTTLTDGLLILAGESDVAWEPGDLLRDRLLMRVPFEIPAYADRLRFWEQALVDQPVMPPLDLGGLATKFRFTPGQIADAISIALNLALWRDPLDPCLTSDDLYEACRRQSTRKLATLAQKITPHYTWQDITLPPDCLQQLREICHHIQYRALVYESWGFEHKLAMGKGLNVLFAGPSGTGKTMAAEVIAAELHLDLFKIDLSSVVSKYIGETEKNIAQIFEEAESSNAILFFDEADALFGKRGEINDSHDRYANIEVSYLLQRMEAYTGIVILATNLKKNMDEAFVRRLHFAIDFPFPSEAYRYRIWQHIWHPDTPLSDDIDLQSLAGRYELAGGNIRNVALSAAFLAAADGQIIQNTHLMQAIRREYQKMGKVIIDGRGGI